MSRPGKWAIVPHERVDQEVRPAAFYEGGNEIRVRLLPEAVEAIRCYPRIPGCPWVFPNAATGKPFDVDSDKMWWKSRAAVGLDHVRVHDLRHPLGQYLAEIGVAMVDIKEVLGHSSVTITERYYLQYSNRNSAERVFAAVTEARRREGTLRRVK